MKLKPYLKYKDSGIQWIGEIPEEWDVRRLKSFIPFVLNGQWGEESDENNGSYIVLRVADFGEFNFNLDKELTRINVKNTNLKIYDEDLVIEKSGGGEKQLVGRVVQLKHSDKNEKYTYSNFIGKLILTNLIKSDFLNYYFSAFYSNRINYNYIKQTTGIQNLDISLMIQNEYFGFPLDLKEQILISSFLDSKTSQISQTIEKDRQLIELLKEKRTALINNVVTKGLNPKAKMKDSGIEWIGEVPEGWEVRKIKQVSDVRISNIDKKSEENEPDVFLCNYVDVYKNEFITSEINFMKATASIEQIKKFTIKKEDVIITKDSEEPTDIAVPALVMEDFKGVVCGYHLALIKPNKKYLSGGYLFRSFQSKKINDQFVIEANGVTRFGISTYPINNSFLIIPPKSEQIQISEYLDKATSKIDQTIKKIGEKIEHLEEFKKSLIHHVVTGKVDVRDEI